MKLVEIYCDGACTGNPGPGGFGAVLLFEQSKGRWRQLEISGGYRHTTNNRMELTAALEALKRLKYPNCRVKLYSDSQYMIHAFNKCWVQKWVKNNWRNAKLQPIVNKDLWEKLLLLHKKHDIEWIKVRGHSGNKYNEMSDKLACAAKRSPHYQSKYLWVKFK